MITSPTVYGFTLSYHVRNSRSHEVLISTPLTKCLQVHFSAWDGIHFPFDRLPSDYTGPLIFHQFPPPHNFPDRFAKHLVWIPMWDHVRQLEMTWWRLLSKTIRIVAFSSVVADMAEGAGLRTLML